MFPLVIKVAAIVGLPAAAILLLGILWPAAFDVFKVFGLNNPFRNTSWIPRWFWVAVYAVLILVIGFEFHTLGVVFLGFAIFASKFLAKELEFLGPWNIGAWRWSGTLGIVTMASAAILGYVEWLFDLSVLVAAIVYVVKYDREFINFVWGFFGGKSKSA